MRERGGIKCNNTRARDAVKGRKSRRGGERGGRRGEEGVETGLGERG